MDLYTRIEEIQGMTRTLIDDVNSIKSRLGSRAITDEKTKREETNRRFYVRAIFALIEAVVEQHKQLLLQLKEENIINLNNGVYEVLSEKIYIANDTGKINSKEQYLNLQRKIRTVYSEAGQAFGESLNINYGNDDWRTFQSALKIRDKITHPKRFADCEISDEDLETVEHGHTWFRNVNNEFVRVARKYRNQNPW